TTSRVRPDSSHSSDAVMGQSDRHPDRRSCLLPSGLDMTWPLEHFLTASARACDRLFAISLLRSSSTAHAINLSTSRPITSASSSAATNTRRLTHRAHRRDVSYPIHQ